jgi:hypothetical protein
MKTRGILVLPLLVVLAARAADLPPHAVAVDRYGTWTCESGYLLRAHRCVSEEEAAAVPKMIVSDVPSAGEGARHLEGEASGSQTGGYAAPEASRAQPAPGSLFIQSDQPWTVVLDAAGNPSTVILGGLESRRTRRCSGDDARGGG